ncbi:PE-PGRS family protein PE_PGRS3-like [Rhopilema esculentum]|uniref:PE-PGRS family protein PE_PGRS3-like n=1 Tax=Rhopilema esculentum TaxID=499914 RepID=UPI0031E0CFA4
MLRVTLVCFSCLSILSLSNCQISRLSCRRSGAFEVNKSDQRQSRGVIKKKLVPSLLSCHSACTATSNCDSLNFQTVKSPQGLHECELLKEGIEGEEWENSTGWYHYVPIQKVASRCQLDTCPVGHTCIESCEKPEGYACKHDPCMSEPCKNNATCSAYGETVVCQCKQGFEGTFCESAQTCSFGCTTPVCSNLGEGVAFTTQGRTGRSGVVQTYTVPKTATYEIKVAGAKGGSHLTNYGDFPGLFCGGNGALMVGEFNLNAGLVLQIAVGHRGGYSVEVQGGTVTTNTAASLGKSVEDNAGTGGGGGSFVYTSANELLIAAGGGGGASSGWNGVDGSRFENGTDTVGKSETQKGRGGSNGQQGACCNTGSYPGGVGAGWLSQGVARTSESHGDRGGSRLQTWIGGLAGKMNSGNNGGPAPGAVGGFGGGGGGSEDNGASGGGGGYSGGGAGTHSNQGGGGGGSYCSKTLAIANSCVGITGGNKNHYGYVVIKEVP